MSSVYQKKIKKGEYAKMIMKTRFLTKIATFLIALILTVPAFLPWTGRSYSAAAEDIAEETSESFYFYPGASVSADQLHYIRFRLCLDSSSGFLDGHTIKKITIELNVEETEYEYIETSKELTLADFNQNSSGLYYKEIVVKADYETQIKLIARLRVSRRTSDSLITKDYVAESAERSVIEVFAAAVENNSPQVAASENYETILNLVERHNNGENINEFISEVPIDPETPDTPDTPNEPENPDEPSNPDSPEDPENPDNSGGTEDSENPAGNNDPETSDNTPETDNTSDSEENMQEDVSEQEDERNNESTYKSMYTILIVVGFIVMLIIAVSMFLPKRRS